MSINWDTYSDEKLVALTLKGESMAYQQIYLRYQGLLQYFFISKSLDHATSEDLVHNLFLKLPDKLPQYDPERPFKPWIFTVAYNMFLDEWRRRQRQQKHIDAAAAAIESPHSETVTTATSTTTIDCNTDAHFDLTQIGLESLDPLHRQILELRYLQELSYDEMSARMGLNSAYLRQIVSRSLKRLKTQLTQGSKKGSSQ